MKHWFLGGALALAFGTAAVNLGQEVPFPTTAPVLWQAEYGEAQRVARETGRPLFVVFRCER